ncbi:MAG: chromate transporter [Lachnospiraceae bacterium]|nr:chromate transporter [Lachnospiraceae bacterium]
MKKTKRISLVSSMLKIGVIGFGGGTALIPVIENEIVEHSGIITEEEYNKEVMIASITPGALPVEIAAGIGLKTGRTRGMIAAASAMAFPGAALTLLLLLLFSGAGEDLRTQIGFVSAGISVFIIIVLIKYVTETVKQAQSRREKAIYLFVLLAVFALSGEKNIYELLGLPFTPVFSISAIQILTAAFFVILFTRGELRRIKRTIPALVLTLAYFLSTGSLHVLPLKLKPYLLGLMLILSALGLFHSVSETACSKNLPLKQLSSSLSGWLLFTLLLSLPAICLTRKTFSFLGTGFISSVMSFGGGDAYLSIAQDLFVDSGIISHREFYGNIAAAANVLPGSILCKILTGIGYTLGYGMNQSVTEGILMAVSGFACSVASSGIIFTIVRAFYEKYESLQVFTLLKRFVRPIISGLLLNVAISLYLSAIQPQLGNGLPSVITLLVTAVLFVGNLRRL